MREYKRTKKAQLLRGHVGRTGWKLGVFGLLIALASVAQAANNQEPALSAAERHIVARGIATLKAPADRTLAANWSNAKKVAEWICRPAALPVVRRQDQRAGRVVLGTDDLKSLTLETNGRLTGSGLFRTVHGWTDFNFACEVNPETAKVTNFQIIPHPAHP
jgi:hypothetical protein